MTYSLYLNRRNGFAKLCVVVLTAVGVMRGSRAEAAVDFVRSAVNLPASTTAFEYSHDLDGDGRMDLLAIYQRRIMIFFQNNADAFPSAPDIEIGSEEPVPATYAQVSIGKVSGDPGEQILLIGPEGVDYVSVSELKGQPSHPVEPHNLIAKKLSITPGPTLDYSNAATDLDGDGKTDVVVPTFDHLEIFSADAEQKFTLRGRIPLTMRNEQTTKLATEPSLLGSSIFSGTFTGLVQTLPATDQWHAVQYAVNTVSLPVLITDFDRDTRMDVVQANRILYQQSAGRFTPVQSTIQSRIYSAIVPHENRNALVSQPNLVDFNGDGALDTFRVEVSAAKLSPRTDVSVYLGRPDRSLPEQPDMVLRTRDFAYSDALPVGDINGDGVLDIALFHLDFQASSASSQLKAYLRNGLEGDLRFYLYDKRRNRFPDSPSFTFPVIVSYDIYGARQFFRQQVVTNADMSGDGLADLVLKTGPQQFSVFTNTGPEKVGFAKAAAAVVPTNPTKFSSIAVAELNADKRGDVVISGYIEGQDDRIIYSMFLSK
ncbi:MAG: FG-GAP repeat domain-containing protein [Candidatus Sumerlaeaceae bacterium]